MCPQVSIILWEENVDEDISYLQFALPFNPNQLPPKWVKNKCVSKCLNSSKTNNAIKKILGGDIFDT